jgi:two-component system sensor histidine kinase RegB
VAEAGLIDRPLLALTRARGDGRAGTSPDMAATENMRQLIQLRWMAVVGQLLTIMAVHLGLGVPLPLARMLAVVAALVTVNLLGMALLARDRVTNVELTLALLFDMGALTAQLYLSGGVANPFISFYLLQLVLGAILLERWSAWVLVAVASLCFAGLIRGSHPLVFPRGLAPEIGDFITLGLWISFVLTGTLLALFITRISRNLRARDAYLADMRQHAAEEDGIVRMGLFASGAAHELGTPLATLSVILNDWRRMPLLTNDPELRGELEEMQAEVQRCKAIVTDILHSAGEPRGEAMEATPARAFLDDVVAAWQPTHPNVPLDHRSGELGGAALVGEASLRQAIWNLLDNAAEMSPLGIGLHATRHPDGLAIAVTDQGPGFSEAQLAAVGRPSRSIKGEGHGLGLFLAANVARRQGGRLEATNRIGGGAEVRLVLPLAPERRRER